MTKCDRCKKEWNDELISKLILFPEGGNGAVSRVKICQDCRNKVWNDFFA